MSGCIDCKRYWFDDGSDNHGFTTSDPGPVCDGKQNPGIRNLNTFPFKQAPEKCFEPKRKGTK
jgi:hypothetical protein